MDELSKEVASQSSIVLGKAYADVAHPALSSLGDTLSLVPRTVAVILGPWKKWVVNGENNIEEAIRQVDRKMGDVPEDCFASLHLMLWYRLFSSCRIRMTVRI